MSRLPATARGRAPESIAFADLSPMLICCDKQFIESTASHHKPSCNQHIVAACHIWQANVVNKHLCIAVQHHAAPYKFHCSALCTLQRFDFVLSPGGTRASATLLKRRLASLPQHQANSLQALEVGAEAMAVAEEVALRIAHAGGLGLFIDYGQDAPYDSSLNAIKRHEAVHPLQVRCMLPLPALCE